MCSLINESQIWGSWYRPPSLLRLGWCTRIWMASRTPLANQSSSLSRILALARETEWDGLSRLMWLETSEWIELGRRCSRNLDLRDFSVSPIYDSLQGLSSVASLPSHLMWYTTPHASWGGMGSLGLERICLIFWAGQRYDLTPADLKILCVFSATPLMWGTATLWGESRLAGSVLLHDGFFGFSAWSMAYFGYPQLTHSVLKLIILFMKISFLCNKLFLTNTVILILILILNYSSPRNHVKPQKSGILKYLTKDLLRLRTFSVLHVQAPNLGTVNRVSNHRPASEVRIFSLVSWWG